MLNISRLKVYIVKNIHSISAFVTVGLLATFINFASFTLLWKILEVNYQIAVSISYILSVIFHFLANRRFAFKSHNEAFSQHIVKYLIMILLNYVITFLMVHVVVESFHLSPYIGIVLAIGVTTNTSYFLLRYWVFSPVENS